MITNRALPVLTNLCVVTDKFNRQYDKEFGQKGRKIGATCNVRVPPRYLGTFGPALNVEPSTETYVPVPILYQFHVDVQFNTINMLLDIDEFEERFIHPACMATANRVDSDGSYFAFQNTANRQGTPGTTPTSYKAFSDSRAILVSEGMPRGLMPNAVLHPLAQSAMADSLKGLFNPQARIDDIYETGMVAKKTAGFDWFEDPNIANYSTGSFLGTPVLAGVTTAVGGSAIVTAGWAQTGVLNLSGLTASSAACYVGDTIQIAGVYPVNPQNRGQYGRALKQFVVTANVLAGATSIPIYPAIIPPFNSTPYAGLPYTPQQYQTVTASPANNATITPFANASVTYRENMAYAPDAITLVVAPLWIPPNEKGVIAAARHNYDQLSMRSLVCYEPTTDQPIDRLDILFGSGVPRPEWICQVADSTP